MGVDRISLPMLDMPSLVEPEPQHRHQEKSVEVEQNKTDMTLMDGPCELDPITGELKRIEEPEPSVDKTIEPESQPEHKAESKPEPRKLESVKKPVKSKNDPEHVKI